MPATLAVASSCVALSGVPYIIAAGVAQVIVGVIFPPDVTVSEVEPAMLFREVAVIVVVPAALPLARPGLPRGLLNVATLDAEELQ